MTAQELLSRLDGVTNTGKGWTAHCPAHEDKNPSLSINQADDGKILLKCHAGCEFKAITSALGVNPKELSPPKQRAELVKSYPYRDVHGTLLYEVCRYEPKAFRQRQPKAGGGWEWNLNGVDRVLYRLPEVLTAAATGERIILAEGEKDVDALVKLGVLGATCCSGGAIANSAQWSATYTAALKGAQDVVVIADKDRTGRKHAWAVREAIRGQVASVKVIELPDSQHRPVKDAADWIAAGGTLEELSALIAGAPQWNYDPRQDERADTSRENGQKGGRPRNEYADAADLFADTRLRDGEGRLTLRFWHGAWFAFRDNGWSEISEKDVDSMITTFMRSEPALRSNASRNFVNSVKLNLQAEDLCGISPFLEKPVWLDTGKSARNWVAFGNGVAVNLRDYAEGMNAPEDYTRQVSPDYFSGDFVSYDWSPESTCPMFMKFLNRIMPTPEGQKIAQEMLGLLIADTCRYEVFFQLYGNGANGKSTLIDVIQALVGRHNISFVQLAMLNERFQSWPLAESKVNVCGDMPTDIGHGSYAAMEGAFKDTISGGMIECERKGRDKFSAPCRARFVMASNTLPTFVDRSDGIWRRLRILNFPVQIPEEERDPDLARKITAAELSGILMFAIEGLRRVIANNGIWDTEEGRQMKEVHRRSCDHEQEFLLEHYAKGEPGAKTEAKKLYEHYHGWMIDNGYRPLGASKFYSRLEAIFPFTQRKKMRIDGVLTNGFPYLVEAATTDIFD